MLEFLLADANIPFAIAIALMLIMGFFEGVGAVLGLSFGNLLDSLIPDIDTNPDFEIADTGSNNALSRLLGWLKVGKVPILMLLVVFLFAFGCIGYTLNLMALSLLGFLLPAFIAAPVAFFAALPGTRLGASALHAIMPKDESSSISLEELIGREAIITLGQASCTQAAEARVRDQHGANHYIMVVAEEGHEILTAGIPLLLVRRTDNQFVAIKNPSHSLK
ncbi:MAG TPA: YqiJ family protein [Cellvibrionaceae bacterium]